MSEQSYRDGFQDGWFYDGIEVTDIDYNKGVADGKKSRLESENKISTVNDNHIHGTGCEQPMGIISYNKEDNILKYPIQPIITDNHGAIRFKANAIVQFLLTNGPFNLNDIAAKGFPQEDEEQFVQLIGYDIIGFEELSFVSKETRAAVRTMHIKGKTETNARIEYLENTIAAVRTGMKLIVPELFRIHPDDLEE